MRVKEECSCHGLEMKWTSLLIVYFWSLRGAFAKAQMPLQRATWALQTIKVALQRAKAIWACMLQRWGGDNRVAINVSNGRRWEKKEGRWGWS